MGKDGMGCAFGGDSEEKPTKTQLELKNILNSFEAYEQLKKERDEL